MADIIDFSKAKDELDENMFTIRDESGEMKDMMYWDASDWQELFGVFVMISEKSGRNPWEHFADFMQAVLSEE